MYHGKKVLAVVPARSGSKGLPHKNIRPLLGKPLLVWSLEIANNCSYIDQVMLSTDSSEYSQIASKYGAIIPCLRPSELSTDSSTSVDVVLHALDAMHNKYGDYDIVMLLEPTSPLRVQRDLLLALELISSGTSLSAVGICRAETIHPSFMFRLGQDSLLIPFLGTQPDGLRRQDIEELYFLEGSIYASDVSYLRKRMSFYHEYTGGVLIPYERSAEVDTLVDFLFIEAMLKSNLISLS